MSYLPDEEENSENKNNRPDQEGNRPDDDEATGSTHNGSLLPETDSGKDADSDTDARKDETGPVAHPEWMEGSTQEGNAEASGEKRDSVPPENKSEEQAMKSIEKEAEEPPSSSEATGDSVVDSQGNAGQQESDSHGSRNQDEGEREVEEEFMESSSGVERVQDPIDEGEAGTDDEPEKPTEPGTEGEPEPEEEEEPVESASVPGPLDEAAGENDEEEEEPAVQAGGEARPEPDAEENLVETAAEKRITSETTGEAGVQDQTGDQPDDSERNETEGESVPVEEEPAAGREEPLGPIEEVSEHGDEDGGPVDLPRPDEEGEPVGAEEHENSGAFPAGEHDEESADGAAREGGDTEEPVSPTLEGIDEIVNSDEEPEEAGVDLKDETVDELAHVIEAIVFASDEPLTVNTIKSVLDASHTFGRLNADLISARVAALNNKYESEGSGFRIVEIANGYQFATRKEMAQWVSNLFKERSKRKLSMSALESLAIIAYKQPITKPEIESIRGVNVDYVLHSLLEKELVTVVGRAESVGRPLLYGTTQRFLKVFALKNLDDLPKLREIDEIIKEIRSKGTEESIQLEITALDEELSQESKAASETKPENS